MAAIKKRRHQKGTIRKQNGSWVLRYYPAPGKTQQTEILGRVKEMTKSDARTRADEFLRPLNLHRIVKQFETVESFVKEYIARKKDTGRWRKGTSQNAKSNIETHILPTIGKIRFDQLSSGDLRDILNGMCDAGLSEQTVRHVYNLLRNMCKLATADGYLSRDIGNGLEMPLGRLKERKATEKAFIPLDQYKKAWRVMQERERLMCDLLMFSDLRQSEVFALRCGAVLEDRIIVTESWYRGKYDDTKTGNSRAVAPNMELLGRLRAWISKLPLQNPDSPVFPSLSLVTPISPDNVLRRHLHPAMDAAGLPRIDFRTLRTSASTNADREGADPEIIAEQQGHSREVHDAHYLQRDLSKERAENDKLYLAFRKTLEEEG